MQKSAWILFVASSCCLAVPLEASLVYDGTPSVARCIPNSTTDAASTSENLATRIRNFARGLSQHLPPSVTKKLLQAPVSTECSLGLLKMMRGLSNLDAWAMRMLDSTAKVPGSLFLGSVSELGSFDECLDTVVKDESGDELVRAQYCSFYLRAENDTSLIDLLKPALFMTHPKAHNLVKYLNDPRVPGFRWGICVVSDCSEEELEAVGRALMGDMAGVNVRYCTTGVPPVPTTSQIAVAAVLAAIAVFMAAGTITDICTSKERKPNVGVAFLLCFSIPANLKMLGSRTKKGSPSHSLLFMHGLRAVSIYYVVFGHATFEFSFASGGMAFTLSYLDRYDSVLTGAAFMAVETFFFLSCTFLSPWTAVVLIFKTFGTRDTSGYLLFYVLHDVKKARGLKETAAIILRRWYRLLVPMTVAACGFSLMPLLVRGPTTAMVYDKFYEDVRNHWWTFVFNTRNLYREPTYGVAAHIWFLSADFQLFLLALLIYQITQRRRVIVAAFALLSAAGCCFTAWQVYGTKYTPVIVMMTKNFDDFLDNLTDLYMLPTYHAASYFGGCITFYAVEHYKKNKISKGVEAALWATAIGLSSACVIYRYEWTRGTEHGNLAKVLLALGDRVLWATALAAFTFLCVTGRGGVVQRALSAAPLAVLSRLSFGVYLLHFPFYFLSSNAMRVKRYMNVFYWFSESISVYVWSCLLALLLFLACEAPLGRLDKIVWGKHHVGNKEEHGLVTGKPDHVLVPPKEATEKSSDCGNVHSH